jgi:hypothetical protein
MLLVLPSKVERSMRIVNVLEPAALYNPTLEVPPEAVAVTLVIVGEEEEL